MVDSAERLLPRLWNGDDVNGGVEAARKASMKLQVRFLSQSEQKKAKPLQRIRTHNKILS